MNDIYEFRRAGGLAERLTPMLSRIVATARLRAATRFSAVCLDTLQDNGAGTGWDMNAETSAVVGFNSDPDRVSFSVGAKNGERPVGLTPCRGDRTRSLLVEPAASCGDGYSGLGLHRVVFIRAAFFDEPGELHGVWSIGWHFRRSASLFAIAQCGSVRVG